MKNLSKYSKKTIEETLLRLIANKGDITQTSEETGIPIRHIGMFKKEAFRQADIVRIKQSKEFLEVAHNVLIKYLRSDSLKAQLREAPLKEVTEFLCKFMDKLGDYQSALGITGITVNDVANDLGEAVGKTRKPEELGENFSLTGESSEPVSTEIQAIEPPDSTTDEDVSEVSH